MANTYKEYGITSDGQALPVLSGSEVPGRVAEADNAQNAHLLDNKPPEYYLQVEDLLDNGDLAIAQAGRPVWDETNNRYTSGLHGNKPYAADRWSFEYGEVRELAGYVQLSTRQGAARSYLVQSIPASKKNIGTTHTFAIYFADGSISVVHGDFITAQYKIVSDASGNVCEIGIEQAAVVVGIDDTPINVKLCRLLPGTYTADTLPPFVPRPYAVELAECMAEYQILKKVAVVFGSIEQGSGEYYSSGFTYPTPMRKTPTINILKIESSANRYGIVNNVEFITEIDHLRIENSEHAARFITSKATYAGCGCQFYEIELDASY